jgi:hypothetical protein
VPILPLNPCELPRQDSGRMLEIHWMSRCCVMLLLLVTMGCKPAEEPDLLLGKWKVFYIDRGGMILGGPGFKGTEYEFRENGTVFAQATSNNNQDTLTSRYERRNDTLVYISLVTQAEEAYRIDSLTENRLVISSNVDGTPTVVRMLKIKK